MSRIYRQVVFYPMAKRGTNLTNPDGSTWDLLEPSDADYYLQFVECFACGRFVLGRYMSDHGDGREWFTGETHGTVYGSMGELPIMDCGGGGRSWEHARAEFAQWTGEYIPDSWQELARITG